jgi:hypothetical protein
MTDLEYAALVAQGRDPVREHLYPDRRLDPVPNGSIYYHRGWTLEVANSPQMWGLIVYKPGREWVTHQYWDSATIDDAIINTQAYIDQLKRVCKRLGLASPSGSCSTGTPKLTAE